MISTFTNTILLPRITFSSLFIDEKSSNTCNFLQTAWQGFYPSSAFYHKYNNCNCQLVCSIRFQGVHHIDFPQTEA